jgi:hypothetical protein
MLTPPIPLHLSGPPDESAQLVVSIRDTADSAWGVWDPVAYLRRKASTKGNH